MSKWNISKEQAIAEMKKIMDQINDGTFEGVLVFSNKLQKRGFILAEKGFAEDRIYAIDAIFNVVYTEPNVESQRWMMLEMLKRWKHYFPNLFLCGYTSLCA